MSAGIAVLGLACRVPGAPDAAAFQAMLLAGQDAIGPVPPERWDARIQAAAARGAYLPRIDLFDHAYFGITPREARLMDPQQRLLLEEAVHCIEDAGVAPSELQARRTAVFVGMMALDYAQNLSAPGLKPEGYAALGVHSCLMANRISHVFGLSGESVAVDAACASGLFALHHARRALLAGECDYALVAAVSLNVNPWRLATYDEARMLSPGYRSAAFDVGADGFGPGEGVITLLLRRADAAQAAGQRLRALVLGSAVGHVGGAAGGVTAPSIAAERAVMQAAMADAGVEPGSIGYIEAHGTGTALGDPIEVEAVNQAFAGAEPGLLIGSVKTNIGHLEAAAGLAGMAKVLLMLDARRVAPTLHLTQPNPLIDFASGPVRPALATQDWLPRPGSDGLLRAGVSSFGFGGAVSHAVLEQAPEPAAAEGWHGPFLLSAHTPAALAALWARWRAFADTPAFASLRFDDVTGTLARGRRPLRHRLALLVQDAASLREALAGDPPARLSGEPRVLLRTAGDAAADLATLQACGIHGFGTAAPLDRADLDRVAAGLVVADADAASALLAQAQALAASNFTFRAYLQEWQGVLGPRGPLDAWLATPPEGADLRLLLLVLVTTLRRLALKWALPDRHAALGPAWHEAATLLLSGVLPQSAAMALADAAGLDAIPIANPAPDLVVLLGDAAPQPGETVLHGAGLDTLTELWLRGAPVDWSGLPGRHRTLPLPAYPFEPHLHWVPLPSTAPAFSMAEDHVIAGRALVPAAEMLAAMGSPLHDVLFARPVDAADAPRLHPTRYADHVTLDLDGTPVCSARIAPAPATPWHGTLPAGSPLDAATLQARFAALGYAYGASLQVLTEAMVADDAIACRVACRGNQAAALEGILQACLVAADRWGLVQALHVPAAVDRLVAETAPPEFTVIVHRAGLQRHPHGFACNAVALGPHGVWASLDGARFAIPAWAATPGAEPTPEPAPEPASSPLPAILEAVAAAIEVDPAAIDPAAHFAELGVDSIVAAEVARAIAQSLGTRVPLHLFSDHPTPEALAKHLAPLEPSPAGGRGQGEGGGAAVNTEVATPTPPPSSPGLTRGAPASRDPLLPQAAFPLARGGWVKPGHDAPP